MQCIRFVLSSSEKTETRRINAGNSYRAWPLDKGSNKIYNKFEPPFFCPYRIASPTFVIHSLCEPLAET